jgi:hypothetical protein
MGGSAERCSDEVSHVTRHTLQDKHAHLQHPEIIDALRKAGLNPLTQHMSQYQTHPKLQTGFAFKRKSIACTLIFLFAKCLSMASRSYRNFSA